ncbi:hypothetical protein ASG93_01535 [Paenibacillus sp. Soil787]|nr:hypothetical protein ASG93_01535 [Paenibacillus sp. Soil787]
MRIVDRLAKWKMHRFYERNPLLAKHLPPTAVMTPSSLAIFLGKYKTVYIKGNTVHTGKAVIKAWKTAAGYKYVWKTGKVLSASSPADLFQQIKRRMPHELFILQQGIDLARVKGRAFDVRVMIMRNRRRRWHYAGMIAKIHGPRSVVSNYSAGASYTSIENALGKAGFTAKKVEGIKRRMIALSRAIIFYSEKYPFFSYQSGIDLAVDKKGNIWIIEVNLHNPGHFVFKVLKDNSYQTIKHLFTEYCKYNKRRI